MCCYSLIRLLFLADKINEREKAKAAAVASIPPPGSPPTVFELLQCWLLYGPSLTTYSTSEQSFQQMLTCWDSSSYRAYRTPLPPATEKQFADVYGRFFQGEGQTRGFPYIQLEQFRQCWAQYGDGTVDQKFLVMMDVWEKNGRTIREGNYKPQPQMEMTAV